MLKLVAYYRQGIGEQLTTILLDIVRALWSTLTKRRRAGGRRARGVESRELPFYT